MLRPALATACRDGTWSPALPHPQPGLLPRGSCWPCLPAGYTDTPVLSPEMAEELSELLREFDEVMEDFERGPASQYQQHLEELKRKVGQSVYDSGIDELESESGVGGGWCLSGWELCGSSMVKIFLLMLPDSSLVGWMSNTGG